MGDYSDPTDLPADWKVAALGEICQPRKAIVNPNDADKLPYVGLEHLDSGELSILRWGNSVEVRSSKTEFREGDVLYGKLRPYLDKAALATWRGLCTTELIALQSDPDWLIPDFLLGLVHSRPFIEHAVNTTSGTNLPRTSWNSLKEFQVALPPLPEQQAIARVLRSVQKAKEATEKVIVACRRLKQSLMRHLFTYGPVPFDQADKVELKDTEIGPVPEHWHTTSLGDLGRIGNGSTPKRTNDGYWQGGTIPWLTSGKIHERIIRQADEVITEQARAECHLPLVKKGSLLVAITGQGKTLGNAAMLAVDSCVSQHLAYIQLEDPAVVSAFLLSFLHTQYEELRKAGSAGGSTKGALTCGYLKGCKVPVPPKPEQQAIARTVEVVEQKLQTESARHKALTTLFNTLLHDLMTGKVRVV